MRAAGGGECSCPDFCCDVCELSGIGILGLAFLDRFLTVLPNMFCLNYFAIRLALSGCEIGPSDLAGGVAAQGGPPIGFDDEDLAATKSLGDEGLAATGSAIKPVRAIPDACEDIPRDGARLFG
jgi:hypothetical protein